MMKKKMRVVKHNIKSNIRIFFRNDYLNLILAYFFLKIFITIG